LATGAAYLGAAKYINIGISILVTAILARLLTPSDFGTIAIVTVYINFISLLTSAGLSPAIIQNNTLSQNDLSNIFTFTIYGGLIASIITCILAPIIGVFYSDARLVSLCMLLAFNVFFSIVNIVPNALLFKNKRFRYISIRTVFVQFILGVISVIAANYGAGIYALLINPIVGSIIVFLISYKCYPLKLSIRPSWMSLRKVLSYSVFQMCFDIVNYTYRNIDKLLIGRYFSLVQLGYYEKSYRLMMLPLSNISNVINPVLHPLLCEHQDDKDFIFQKYAKIIQYFAYLGFAITAVSFFCA